MGKDSITPANKIPNKTTVSEFVTHEPYDRASSTARIKKYIAKAMKEIKESSPDLTSAQLKEIKKELLKNESISAVADKLNKLVKLNDEIKLPIAKLQGLIADAKNIESLIKNNVKQYAMNFVMGQIQATDVFKAAKSFFSGGGGFSFSDRRLKEDIRLVGKSPMGVNVYSFKYKQLPGRYMGVMAQEVPWARHKTDTGYYAVDYSKVDVEFRRLH